MSMKIKVSTMDLICLVLTVVRFSFIPNRIYVLFKYLVILYLLCKYLKKICLSHGLTDFLLFYTIILSISTFFNTHSVTWVISAFMTGIQYVLLFCVFFSFCKKNGINALIKKLFILFSIMIVINDILMLVMPYEFFNSDESYLIGNKFLVSYFHCFWACLFYVKNRKRSNKIISLLSFVFTGFIASVVHCTTGIIMSVILIIMSYLPKWIKGIIEKPNSFIIALLIENILIWSPIAIFTNPFVVYLIKDIFHKSVNMTGRHQLYSITLELVAQSPIWGYGHNTDIYRNTIGYGNAQNGLFHIITQAGIVGAIFYFFAVNIALRNCNKDHYNYGMYMYIFAMLVASAIEINLSAQFLLGVAIIYSCGAYPYMKSRIDNNGVRDKDMEDI